MAKKTVATLHGAYIFDEQMVPNEAVKDFFKN